MEFHTRIGQLQLHELLPPAQAIYFGSLQQLARDGFNGGIDAESHVPDLAGEDQQDGAQLEAELPGGKQGHHGDHHAGKKTENGDGLQGIEQGDQDALGAGIVRGHVAVDKGHEQAEEVGDGHARERKKRVLGQGAGLEVNLGLGIDRSRPVLGQRQEGIKQRHRGEDDGQVAQQAGQRICGLGGHQ
jgi:hypothetical protein